MKKIISILQVFLITIIFYSCESNDSPVTDNTPVATVPQLLSPENNSTVSTLEPTFDWVDLPNASNYKLQVSANSSFNNLILDTSGLTSSNYNAQGNILNDSNSYYWRVKGISSSDTTDWSNSFSFSTSIESINATNKVLVEIFTNTSCVPCVQANTYLDEIYNLSGVTSNDANVLLLRVHTTLFAGDPFYLYNTTDNDARMAFYPNSAIVNPRTYLLGTFMGNFSSAPWTNKINEKLADTRTYAIKLTNTYDPVSRSGNINIKIKQVSGAVVNDLVYHLAVAENEIAYSAPNGETFFSNTLRDLITPPTGQPFTISPGQTNSYNQSYNIDTQINQNLTDLVVFIQRNNNSGREVLAVEKISLK
ncbi:MAG: hypothetical protein M3R36_04395 [Bacteroidota bacterium]|nr:hypothetical protein [Bacteroidota bacterium]